MFKKYIRKADIILFIALVIVGLAASVYFTLHEKPGNKVLIESNGTEYARYNLSEDREILVENGDNSNLVIIKDGRVIVSESTCKNQVCVNHASISQSGETIVCLPNKLVVSIEGQGGGDSDAVIG